MAQQAQHSKKAAEKAVVEGSAVKSEGTQTIASEERQRLIAEAAYLIAEQRGFQGDRALDDWLQAEVEVDARYSARH